MVDQKIERQTGKGCFKLFQQDTSCRAIEYACAIDGSLSILTFIIKGPVYYSTIKEGPYRGSQSQRFSNFTIHIDLHIYNVTPEDEGIYGCHMYDFGRVNLQVAKLWFSNQSDLKTIVGQEGESMDIKCSSDTKKYITALNIVSNGTVKAIGDNQTVSYSFIPDRTDHLTKYQCVDSKHSSIMVEVELSIMYAPSVTVHYTNGTIKCDCDGVPPIYSVYRLDQISKYGELVRSVNLKSKTFTFHTEPFPYQRNGRYMCVVSNGIPDTNGEVLQNWSTNVTYEGPPVFAKENRYVKIGKVEQSSIRISFQVYSCPDVEEIFLEKLESVRGKKRKIIKYFMKSTLLYNEFDNKVGIPGYDISIEIEELGIDDVQAYCITVKNKLGASDYQFEIIKKEDRVINQRERTYFDPFCILGAVLFGSIIVHVGFCAKLLRPKVLIHANVNEDNTYSEIGTIPYGEVSNVHSSDTNDSQGQIPTQQQAVHISNEAIVQSTDNNSTELIADFPNDDLPQREVTDVQEQHMSISTEDTNLINKDQSSDQKSQTSNDYDSESSQNVMIGNVGDGYETPYQTVLQDRKESHQYTQITRESNTSISSLESISEHQILERCLRKEGSYINLQF
ncbi:unnamed protein product [Mytilus coruscus]|uniref:Ig-like domain-containing protein n=1 Tax=Mytilus coruscus TaxID=42192 RepID=A0A6J8C4P2_MYTCO|nr:unnamed protein product [Mytilus coruscus]